MINQISNLLQMVRTQLLNTTSLTLKQQPQHPTLEAITLPLIINLFFSLFGSIYYIFILCFRGRVLTSEL